LQDCNNSVEFLLYYIVTLGDMSCHLSYIVSIKEGLKESNLLRNTDFYGTVSSISAYVSEWTCNLAIRL
jgi:hypothetical protein